MKVGLIGNGGREHAIALGLCGNQSTKLFVAANEKNNGILDLAEDYQQIGFLDPQAITNYFVKHQVDFVVVGPEATLMIGIVDHLREAHIPTVGPNKDQALLEGDKSFMRQLLQDQLGWGSPTWQTVSSLEDARQFIQQVGEIVVKPLGLTGGKGVRVMGIQLNTPEETLAYIESLIRTDGEVLLEERVIGEEFSRMAFISDGVLAPIPIMQDFKYATDGDLGMMTGGMGAYSTANGGLPFIEENDLRQADQLLSEVVHALESKTGCSYRGFLYGQFMATKSGIKLIEFNVRLGDPEALNLMAILAVDPVPLFYNIATGNLTLDAVAFLHQASVSKYLVPNQYPEALEAPVTFSLDEVAVKNAGLTLIHGSVEKVGQSQWRALGSRTFGLVGLGDNPGLVSEKIELFLEKAPIPQLRHRKDVGNQSIIDQKIKKMEIIRSGN